MGDGTEAQQLVALQAWCTRNGSHEKQYNGGHYVPALPNGTCEAVFDRREKFGVFARSYTMNVVHYATPGLIVQAKTVQDIMHSSTLRGNTTYVSPCATQAMHTMGNLPQMVVSLCLCQSSKASQSLLVRTPRSLLAEVAHGALYTRQLMMQDTFPREVMIRLLASWVARLVPATVNSPGSTATLPTW